MPPIALATFPSSVNALCWSPDGDLAVAGGDHVRVLTSTWNIGGFLSHKERCDKWHSTSIETNRFTNAEWPTILTQSREDFSIAAEQSPSLTTDIAWSPSGLARYRRSVLAVLTSNLLLSIWEPAEKNGQWTRVGIINHTLFPARPIRTEGPALRKVNIRSFKWCPPLRVPPYGSLEDSDPESRWGIHLLLVANDMNHVILLQVERRTEPGTQVSELISTDKLATYPVKMGDGDFPTAGLGTLLHKSLQSQARITALSCGPWIISPRSENSTDVTAVTVAAVVIGNQLQLLKITVTLTERTDVNSDNNKKPRFETQAVFHNFDITPSPVKPIQHRLQGPLEWIYDDESPEIVLVISTNSDFITVAISRSAYSTSNTSNQEVSTWIWDISSLPAEDGRPRGPSYERVSALAVSLDEDNKSVSLNIGTHGGLGAIVSLETILDKGSLSIPEWYKGMNIHRDSYAQKQGWGNKTLARVWGLASWRSVSAVLFTTHPTHMIEYRIGTGNYSYLEIVGAWSTDMLFRPDPIISDPTYAREQRAKVITFVLSHIDELNSNDKDDQKMVYHAACCAVADGQPESIRSHARECFEKLAVISGADLSEEIEKCGLECAQIHAKDVCKAYQPGNYLFECCGICGSAGIAWSDATLGQCVNGHLLTRCGLSFQIIQEPGWSKFCLTCLKEYFDEDLIREGCPDEKGPLGKLFLKEFHKFDTCIYCGGKFGMPLKQEKKMEKF